jgi:hypothetical protein
MPFVHVRNPRIMPLVVDACVMCVCCVRCVCVCVCVCLDRAHDGKANFGLVAKPGKMARGNVLSRIPLPRRGEGKWAGGAGGAGRGKKGLATGGHASASVMSVGTRLRDAATVGGLLGC